MIVVIIIINLNDIIIIILIEIGTYYDNINMQLL